MRFIVEVPVYLKLEVDAISAEAAAAAGNLVARIGDDSSLSWAKGANLGDVSILNAELASLAPEEEDREPDVYVCRGGKLTAVDSEGRLEPLDEEC